MPDKILVEYVANVDGFKAQLKSAHEEQKKVSAEADLTGKKLADGFDNAGKKSDSLRTQLKKLKEQLANATDPKEIQRLAAETGKLKDRIDDAADAAKIFASESKFEQLGNGIGSVTAKLRNLDFKGAADQAALLSSVARSLTFKDAIAGIKDMGIAFASLGEAVLLNPVFLLSAAFGVLAFAMYRVIEVTNEQNDVVLQQTKLYDKLVESNKFLNAETDNRIKALSGLKKNEEEIAKLQKEKILRNIEEAKSGLYLSLLKQEQAKTEISLLDRLANVFGGPAQEALMQAKRAAAVANSNKEIKESYLKLESFLADMSKFDNEQAQSTADKNKDIQEKADADAKYLRDLRTQNIQLDYDRQRQILIDKFNDDAEAHKNNNAILVELRKKLNNDLGDLEDERNRKNQAIRDAAFDADIKAFKDQAKKQADALSDPAFSKSVLEHWQKYEKEKTAISKDEADARKKIDQAGLSFIQDLASSAQQIAKNNAEVRVQDAEQESSDKMSILDNELATKQISQEIYNQRKEAIDKEAKEKEAKIRREAFETQQEAAYVQALISTAQGVANALTVTPAQLVPAYIAIALATGAAQAAVIKSAPKPKFAKGIVDLQGKGTKTSDDIDAKLSKGESVITADATEQYKDLLIAMNRGKGREYIMRFLVAPALAEHKRRHEKETNGLLATTVAKAMMGSDKFYDGNILESLKLSRRAEKEHMLMLAQVLKSASGNPRKW